MKAKTKEEIEALPIPEWISAPYSIALAFLESAEFPYDRDKRYVLACLRQLADVHENPDE